LSFAAAVSGSFSIPTKAHRWSHPIFTSGRQAARLSSGFALGLPQAYNYGFSARELREIRELIEANREQIETAWSEFFD
jgi:hypothetical protein